MKQNKPQFKFPTGYRFQSNFKLGFAKKPSCPSKINRRSRKNGTETQLGNLNPISKFNPICHVDSNPKPDCAKPQPKCEAISPPKQSKSHFQPPKYHIQSIKQRKTH